MQQFWFCWSRLVLVIVFLLSFSSKDVRHISFDDLVQFLCSLFVYSIAPSFAITIIKIITQQVSHSIALLSCPLLFSLLIIKLTYTYAITSSLAPDPFIQRAAVHFKNRDPPSLDCMENFQCIPHTLIDMSFECYLVIMSWPVHSLDKNLALLGWEKEEEERKKKEQKLKRERERETSSTTVFFNGV